MGDVIVMQNNGPLVEGVDYDNGKWHWSDRIGAWYTHSLPEAIRSGYEECDCEESRL